MNLAGNAYWPLTRMLKPHINPRLKNYVCRGDEERLVPHPRSSNPPRLDLDFFRYVEFISVTYSVLTATTDLGATIPFCLFQYYCNFLFWRRMAILANGLWGHSPNVAGPDLRKCAPRDVMVPSPLKLCLECIGRVTDPFNITWVPNTVFFWNTTLSLDGFPCPNLSLLINFEKNPMPHLTLWKIEAHMTYTLGSLDDPVWALPNKLVNTPPAPWLHPNRHLLGYHPAEKLTSSQYLTLTRLGFHPPFNYPFQIIAGFPVHKGALKLVNRALRKITPKPHRFPIPKNLPGSLAQLPFAEWLQTPYNHNNDTNLEATIHSHFPSHFR